MAFTNCFNPNGQPLLNWVVVAVVQIQDYHSPFELAEKGAIVVGEQVT